MDWIVAAIVGLTLGLVGYIFGHQMGVKDTIKNYDNRIDDYFAKHPDK